MNRRTRRTLIGGGRGPDVLAVAIFLRSKAPPEAARLLPESDGHRLHQPQPVRAFFHKDLKPPERAAEYQQFIDAIGIDPERDLDEAAIALHRMADPMTQRASGIFDGAGGQDYRQRLNDWLDAHAAARESYAEAHRLLDSLRRGGLQGCANRLRHVVPYRNTPGPRSRYTPCSTGTRPPHGPLPARRC